MSGFFGIAREDGNLLEEKFLEKLAEELRHRGPDGTSVWTDGRVGGCFARMVTGPAKQTERQPAVLGERYLLWGDVRLDGRAELLAELATGNMPIDPQASSEELLLLAWERWGQACLERVIGDYSFGLWDAQEECFWCARDFVGPRPFFYANAGGVFSFSNTLALLREVPEVSGALDEEFLGDFLLEGSSEDAARTIYRDIKRLPPGHVLKFSKGQVDVQRFLKLPIEDALRLKRPEEYIEAYRELLWRAVSDRLPEGSVALYLSGGLDSTSVSAVAAQLAGERGQRGKLKAFTVSWTALFQDDEPVLANLTAQHLGIAHEILADPTLDLFEGARTAEVWPPEPSDGLFFTRARREYLKIAFHSNVVLSGDGGDDVLTGQGWPYLIDLWKRGKWNQIARDFGGYMWNRRRLPPVRGGFKSRIERALKREDPFEGYPVWLNPEFERRVNLRQRWQESRHPRKSDEHPLHPEGYAALHSAYWATVLETEDAGWNHVRLETRAPLLDPLSWLSVNFALPSLPARDPVQRGLLAKEPLVFLRLAAAGTPSSLVD